jgi:diketogulonate reductase-like aldo/keto reductase
MISLQKVGILGIHLLSLRSDALTMDFEGSAIGRRTVLQSTVLTTGGLLLLPPNKAHASSISAVTVLADGTPFPLCSFGLQIYDNDTAYRLTQTALEVGYRNFFASVLAGNQKGFARAVKDFLLPHGATAVNRQDLFICGSVISNRVQGFDQAYRATTDGWKRNLHEFAAGDVYVLDQIMLDYPGPDDSSIQGQWKALEDMYAQGLVKTLSVSNFSPAQLDAVLKVAKVKPVVNQLPFSVAYHPGEAAKENQDRGVLVQAWAPLGKSLGGRAFSLAMKQECGDIGKKHGKSYAQVALRWILQMGGSFTTQSQNREHFAEDLDLFDFDLSPQDMATLTALA